MSGDILLAARAINPSGEDYVIPITRNPSKADVRRLLEPLRGHKAYAGMQHEGEIGFGKPELNLRAENGRYLLTLGEVDADGEHDVRTLTNSNPKKEDDFIGGEFFGACHIVEDFDLVLRAFCEFAETGNVSHNLMD
jgi:hypothetical protein